MFFLIRIITFLKKSVIPTSVAFQFFSSKANKLYNHTGIFLAHVLLGVLTRGILNLSGEPAGSNHKILQFC